MNATIIYQNIYKLFYSKLFGGKVNYTIAVETYKCVTFKIGVFVNSFTLADFLDICHHKNRDLSNICTLAKLGKTWQNGFLGTEAISAPLFIVNILRGFK